MTDSNTTLNRNVKLLRSGDPKSRFHYASASDVLKEVSPPQRLLSTSAKIDKCESVGVLARVLYFTPGAFCPSATEGCLETCLGHTSGRMSFPTHTAARDARTALYLERPIVFMKRLRAELTLLETSCTTFAIDDALHRPFWRPSTTKQKMHLTLQNKVFFSSPGGIRTPDQGIMSPLL